MADSIYDALYALREQLKAEGKEKTGRTPAICSDEVLRDIAEFKPKTLDDFNSINGCGKAFIDNYGQLFLDCIRKNDVGDLSKVVKVDDRCCETLKKLEQKLVTLNTKNLMLYTGKKASKKVCDIYSPDGPDMRELIFGRKKEIVLCDVRGAKKNDPGMAMFNSAKAVVREATKILRDKGHNDLYIAYPYVIGKLPGEDFSVRAPLALIPVTAEKTATKIVLRDDDSRDPIFNNTLLLALYKFNEMDRQLPENVFEDTREEVFESSILNFYNDNGLEVKLSENYPYGPFTEYLKTDFPKFRNGELYLEHAITLGVYSVCTNAIQRDFATMIARRESNELMLDLVRDYSDQSDFYAESYAGIEEIKTDRKEIPEADLMYINDLNSAQEKVLYMMKKSDELVVQGPPGTGKSQTIASLITEFVNDGKTVLMVSEKKTALDVVYSRLGNLSKYALLIDDVGNKQTFYEQLGRMVQTSVIGSADTTRIMMLNQSIDANIARLKEIASKLYTPDEGGFSPYMLYSECTLRPSDPNVKNLAVKTQNESARLPNIPKADLKQIHLDFSNPSLLPNLRRFDELEKEYPILPGVNPGYSELELINVKEHLQAGLNAVDEYNSKGFFGKLFGKGKMKKAVLEAASVDFDSVRAQMVAGRIMMNDIMPVLESLQHYEEYQALKPVHDRFGPDHMEYRRVLETIPEDIGDRNDFLYNNLLYWRIKKFESQNREVYMGINDFDKIFAELSESMKAKRKAVTALTESNLEFNVAKIKEYKNYKEFDSKLNTTKRKWPVEKFIRRFRPVLFGSVKIWMMTPEVVSELIPLESGMFDLLIFDEASQMFIERGLPSIMRAKKVVIAGDHKQLRPNNLFSGRIDMEESDVEEKEVVAALEEESLLDLARAKYNDVLLNFHYRSKYEELIAFSNHAFYGGRLYVSPNSTIPDEPPIRVHMVENAKWVNRTNMEEALEIAGTLKNFLFTRKNEETIGIITFNSDQRDLIEDVIDEACKDDPDFARLVEAERNRKSPDGEDIGLFVKNVENVQGDERDEIVFSIGYAKGTSGRLVQRFGWLNQKGGENRLNVAISRAKKKIRIVQSFDAEELQVDTAKNDGPRILKQYLRYAKAVSDGNEGLAQEILRSLGDAPEDDRADWFDSPFEEEVCNALRGMGYDVHTQVGIGGYRIDMAIKKEGKYVLGIECDGKLYHSSLPARERDYHRQKYLEARGWKIHRIWSSNWWNNRAVELDKIVNEIESSA